MITVSNLGGMLLRQYPALKKGKKTLRKKAKKRKRLGSKRDPSGHIHKGGLETY